MRTHPDIGLMIGDLLQLACFSLYTNVKSWYTTTNVKSWYTTPIVKSWYTTKCEILRYYLETKKYLLIGNKILFVKKLFAILNSGR